MLWLRWRLTRNQWIRGGAVSAVIAMLFLATAAGLAVGGGVGGVAGGLLGIVPGVARGHALDVGRAWRARSCSCGRPG